jgi:tetratricopeptide (TPR) repeat protein
MSRDHLNRFLQSATLVLIFTAANFVWGQGGTALEAEKQAIDRLNDHAWAVARQVPDSAVYYARDAIRRSRKIGDYEKGLINAHVLLGIVYKDRGFYEVSVENYLEALRLAEKVDDKLRISGCLNNLGVVYQEQEDYNKALEYFRNSLELEEIYGKDKEQYSIRLCNIGEAYLNLDSLDQAYAFYYNSLLLELEYGSEEGVFYARQGIGLVDTRRGIFRKAEQELDKALSLAMKLENNLGICETQIAQGELYLNKKEYNMAEQVFDSALARARRYHYQGQEKEALHWLSAVLRARGDYAGAIDRLESYYALAGELNSAAVSSRIGELQMKYELDKKEKEIDVLQQQDLLRQSEMKYDRKLRNYLIVTILFTVLILLLNYRNSRRRHAK